MAINLGAAYVDIVPSTANLADGIKKQVSEPLSKGGDAAGRGFGERFSSGLGSMMSGVSRMITSTVTAATTVAAAGLATSLVSGWSRLTTIQDATAALTISLGDATKAAGLLEDVLAVVTGTPFNLDQFAAAAQRMVGMGIEAQKVPGYLTAIGEAAATQGSRAGEFADRLSTVFGQIAASGQVSLADIWRISDTGVNALTILANHFGITTDEMKKMVSSGAVPATEALDALSKGILEGSDGAAGATTALAGTMEGLRETLSGAAGGFRAGLAQFGAKIIEPFVGALTVGFNTAYDLLSAVGDEIGAVVGRLAESAGFRSFVDWLGDLPNKIGPAIDKLKDLGPALAPIGAGIAALGLGGLSSALGPLGALLPAINPLVAALAAFIAITPELRDAVGTVLDAFGSAFSEAFSTLSEGLAPVLPAISDALIKIGEAFADILVALAPVIPMLAELVVILVEELGVPVLEAMATAITGIAEALVAMGPVLPVIVTAVVAFMGLKAIVVLLLPAVKLLAGAIGLLLTPVGLIIAGLALLAAGAIWAYHNVEWFHDAVDLVGRFLRDVVWPILQRVAGFLAGAFADAWDGVSTAAKELWDSVLQPMWSWFSGTALPVLSIMASALAGALATAFGAVAKAVKAVWDGWLGPLVRWLRGPFQTVMGVVVSLWDTLKVAIDAIKSFGSGVFDALAEALKKLIGPLEKVVDWASRAVGLMKQLSGTGRIVIGEDFQKKLEGKGQNFHTGGIVPGPRGTEVDATLLAGEAVFTHSQQQMLGDLINADSGTSQPSPLIQGDVYVGDRKDLRELDWMLRVAGAGI